MANNKQFKIISIIFGLLFLMAGVVLIVSKSNVSIAYPIALMGSGGLSFCSGSSPCYLPRYIIWIHQLHLHNGINSYG